MVSSRKANEERAKTLLLAHLNPEQQKTYLAEGWFEFKDRSGRPWRLYHTETLLRLGLEQSGRLVNMHKVVHANTRRNDLLESHNVWTFVDRMQNTLSAESDILLSLKTYMEVVGEPFGCYNYFSKKTLGIPVPE